ncbi:MAG: L,D-transpeptidase [Hyphomicrobiaceae bacterium]|nr:L,D-transpeptidase [Hyphomicrobiaceae bacterium]
MRSCLLGALAALGLLAVSAETASAQYWGRPYWEPPYGGRPYWDNGEPYGRPPARRPRYADNDDDDDDDDRPRRYRDSYYGDEVRSGGGRPYVAPISPRPISFPSSFKPGSIVIDTRGRQLFLIESPETAFHYPISVGRDGFSWTGTEVVSRKAQWPDWHPPEEMRDRDPSLPVKMTGGIRNPLGAVAIYLGNTLYRIHGTNDPSSIGRAASSGCFRMLNGHAIDLASRIEVGTPVTVVSRLPGDLERIVASQVSGPRASFSRE